jgi:Fic family protein
VRRGDFAADAPGRLIIAPAGHLAYVPDPLPPAIDLDFSTVNLLADAERALGELKGVGHRLPNPHLFISPFLRREAVLSSRIEGTTAGLQELLVFESAPATDPDSSDVREVANYVTALEHGFSLLEKLPISLRLIREVHEQLMEGVRGQDQRPGEFRQVQNLVGRRGATPETARFVPPPVKEMHEALSDLERFIGERRSELPFLMQLALVHYQFEAIHPFMDGNGRLGRLLIALQLREQEYLPQPLLYLSAYFERHSDAYRDHLLDVSRSGAWNAWIDFFLTGVAEQAHDTAQRSYRLLSLLEHYQSWALSASRTGNLAKLVELLFARPVISFATAEAWLGVTQPGASRLVRQLIDRGILVEVTGKQRNRRFAAPEILEILDAPETGSS